MTLQENIAKYLNEISSLKRELGTTKAENSKLIMQLQVAQAELYEKQEKDKLDALSAVAEIFESLQS